MQHIQAAALKDPTPARFKELSSSKMAHNQEAP